MLPGVSGSLIPAAFLEESLVRSIAADGALPERTRALASLVRWWRRVARVLGPASGARAILDIAVLPLVEILGYDVETVETRRDGFSVVLGQAGQPVALLIVLPWDGNLSAAWRDAVRAGRTAHLRWGLICSGRLLEVVDASRSWTTRTLAFDFEQALLDERSAAAIWSLVRAPALVAASGVSGLAQLIEDADRHGVAVCESLGDGVLDALSGLLDALGGGATARGRREPPTAAFEQALTVVYRLLFLLFAEARAAVPMWHRVYRDSYSIGALCLKSTDGRGRGGLWEALQAIARLAHAGCRAGDLQVTAFNGRLFSPRHTPLAEQMRVPDAIVRRALLALATGPSPQGRRPIAYGDLGVEQLGAVYERVLEYEPARQRGPVVLTRTSRERKSTGSFYTPRSITEFLVRRTLHPLVQGRTAEEILGLRIVDPAMGSGAFLVAACRYLAAAAEQALIAAGTWRAGGIAREDRARLRRDIVQRCLFGVDLNPMAVQLARLSLWLTTLAPDRPLTFLDHHLAAGDSLLGASLADLARSTPGSRARRRDGDAPLPLFDREAATAMAARVLPDRYRLAMQPEETPAAVHDKERTLAALTAAGTPLARWKAALDVWCAAWLSPTAPAPAVLADLIAGVLGQQPLLPLPQRSALTDRAQSLARDAATFHWELEFPEVFFDANGHRRSDAGFDAVLGNPPWDVLRADTGSAAERARGRQSQHARLRFFRQSGVYRAQGNGHPNRYQLFAERAIQLARPHGRIGLILPAGIVADHGSGPVRRLLLDSTAIDRLFGFHNREGIFPIHRDVKFVLLTATAGARTGRLTCRFGETSAAWLESLPDDAAEDVAGARAIVLPRTLIETWDREHLSIPELTSPADLDILLHVTAAIPPLADSRGWHARFGRELNATDDRRHFENRETAGTRGRLPIVEGKHLEPFRARLDATSVVIRATAAATLLDRPSTFGRARIAYRDVASASNRLTLIAAVLPPDTVSTHTIFCLKTPLGEASQYCLLGLLNSLVANYLVRLQVTTHVTVSLMARLPVPRPPGDTTEFRTLASLARELEWTGTDNVTAYARLNALAAHAYGLTRTQYEHIVSTFPLLPVEVRERCVREFAVSR